MKGWDRTNLSTAIVIWHAGTVFRSIASKSGTTWFLTGNASS
jgi:hypothetical protein